MMARDVFFIREATYWPPSPKGSPGEKSRLKAACVSINSKCLQNLKIKSNGVLVAPFLFSGEGIPCVEL